jgi:hypothetical protein
LIAIKKNRVLIRPDTKKPLIERLRCCLERAAGIEPASSAWKAEVIAIIRCTQNSSLEERSNCLKMVEGEGFEPSKAEPSDLQSDPFGHSGTPPGVLLINGADYRSRTGDLLITSQLLYLLS